MVLKPLLIGAGRYKGDKFPPPSHLHQLKRWHLSNSDLVSERESRGCIRKAGGIVHGINSQVSARQQDGWKTTGTEGKGKYNSFGQPSHTNGCPLKGTCIPPVPKGRPLNKGRGPACWPRRLPKSCETLQLMTTPPTDSTPCTISNEGCWRT